MKTKKVITLLALLLAGLFVSAQTYISSEEAAKFEREMRKAETTTLSTDSHTNTIYDLLWGIYFNTPYSKSYATSRTPGFSDSNDQEFEGVPSKYMNNVDDGTTPIRQKYDHRPKKPVLVIDGVPMIDGRPVRR